jgi:CBS domain-containing protein
VLTLRRSILTEKISRRGNHLGREYSVDPLELLFVRDVMQLDVRSVPAEASCDEVARALRVEEGKRRQRLYPVIDGEGRLAGTVTRSALEEMESAASEASGGAAPVSVLAKRDPVLAYADETLRVVAYRMATSGLTRFPVVQRDDPTKVVGLISLRDLLRARSRTLEAEQRRERVLRLDAVLPVRAAPARTAIT